MPSTSLVVCTKLLFSSLSVTSICVAQDLTYTPDLLPQTNILVPNPFLPPSTSYGWSWTILPGYLIPPADTDLPSPLRLNLEPAPLTGLNWTPLTSPAPGWKWDRSSGDSFPSRR